MEGRRNISKHTPLSGIRRSVRLHPLYSISSATRFSYVVTPVRSCQPVTDLPKIYRCYVIWADTRVILFPSLLYLANFCELRSLRPR